MKLRQYSLAMRGPSQMARQYVGAAALRPTRLRVVHDMDFTRRIWEDIIGGSLAVGKRQKFYIFLKFKRKLFYILELKGVNRLGGSKSRNIYVAEKQ